MDNETETFPLHAHIETYATDCDGALSGGYLLTMNDEEVDRAAGGGFGDIQFHNRVLSHVVNTYSIMATGSLTVTRLEDGDVRLSWSEATEEGGRNIEATICTDPCDLGEDAWRRDHQAEEAGY